MSFLPHVPVEQRVLVLAPTAADAVLSRNVLAEASIHSTVCVDVAELCNELEQGVGAILLTDEVFVDGAGERLAATLRRLPAWSDVPILLLAGHGADSPAALWALEALGNVTILERPIRMVTFVSALRTALKARRRQYETRDQMRFQAMLAAVVESSEDAIITKTLDGVITSWNPGAERLFDYAAAEAVGRSISLIIPPERMQEEQVILARLRRGERTEHFETVRVAKSGRKIDISLTISPIRDGADRVVGASKIARDITARKQAQNVLKHSEQRFRFLAEMLPSMVWTADASGAITYANRRWRLFWGLEPAESVKNWSELALHPDDRDRCLSEWNEAVRTGRSFECEVRNRRYDGIYRWFVTRAIPFKDAQGHILAWFGVTTDIHDQKTMQEKLREADRRKDAFLATLAHELRNPLAPIRNGLYLLPRVRDNATKFEDARRMMETQLRHMVHLLDDLMDISRIARNKIQLRKQRVELAWIVNDAVEATRSLIDERRHELSIRLPATPVYLEADSVRLSQVLSNLLNNAAKYTEPGGRITLTAEVEGDWGAAAPQEIAIRVRDTGIGIAPETLPKLFELFVQADNNATNSAGGLGIGLSLVKSLVEMHGGRVEAASEGLDRGSEFVVRLPVLLASTPAPRLAPPESAPQETRPHRILVVDDNRASADSMAMVLRTYGHEVRVAYDGPEALAAAHEFRLDAALLDLGLPGMTGHDLARQLRSSEHGDKLTLIAMTGWGREEDRQRSLEAGFDAHLVKPLKMSIVHTLLASPPEDRQKACMIAEQPATAVIE